MATFKCPFCKGQVDVTAEVCPHCQCEVPESIKGFVKSNLHKVTGSGGPAANSQLRNIKVISNVIAFAILAIPTLLIIWGIRSCTSSVQEAANKPFVPTSFSAWEMCKQFSEKQLKAPSTADFAGESDSRITQLDTNT
ncbi:MAG TPA: hypothetical protein VFK21_12640, partial [Gammaproteobacteria bacterium]|nr:hypothetical protein [Gammaproteobacteria bacterium]